MTSVLNVDTIADKAGTGPVGLTKQTAAKGFVSFNGTGTIASDNSFNLSSLADVGTGEYDASWTNVMGTSVYMMSGMKSHSVSDASCNLKISSRSSNFTASTVRVRSIENGSVNDCDYVSMMCHGDLA